MHRLFIILSVLSLTAVVSARPWDMPNPTRKQVAQAFQRTFVSEAGFQSTADENLVFRVVRGRTGRLKDNPRRLMLAISSISNRTFPPDSPFVRPGKGARTRRQMWISEINLECTAPPSWRADVDWDENRDERPSYKVMCQALRKRTWKLMQGKTPDWCQMRVDHWGGAMDMTNPTQYGWTAVVCDDPTMLEQCAERRELNAQMATEKLQVKDRSNWPIGCARNYGWCSTSRGPCE